MFKNLIQLKSKIAQPLTRGALYTKNSLPRRMFSSNQYKPPTAGGYGFGTMLGLGLGTSGLMWLMYHSRTLQQERLKNLYGTQQMNFFNPVVQ